MTSERKKRYGYLPWLISIFLFFCVGFGEGLIESDSAWSAQKDVVQSNGAVQKRFPAPNEFRNTLRVAYEKYKDISEGKNADYIPYLAKVDPGLYGIVIVTVYGDVYEIGDSKYPFAIESISKVFTLCRVIQNLEARAIEEKIGVNATGLPFNSVMAIGYERQPNKPPGA